MSKEINIDHLFRHQYGKMVSICTRIFGLEHLDTIEDAIQDTFIYAIKSWQTQIPENPEAWLVKAVKHRIIDLLRKISAEDARIHKLSAGIETYAISELFTDTEVDDSVLRMLFAACHPQLDPKDQIAFALKTISGFSRKEIAASLLLKEETVKKRLLRARKMIVDQQMTFEIPAGRALQSRTKRVLEVVYLIFNEGYSSTKKDAIIREDLCGEAVRLSACVLKKSISQTPDAYALHALLCYQSARMKSRITENGEIIRLKEQDRKQWFYPLVLMGHEAMEKAMQVERLSPYHLEAAIAAEYVQAPTYEATNWDRVLALYQQLFEREGSSYILLNMAILHLEKRDYPQAKQLLTQVDLKELESRAYLYFATYAEYEFATNNHTVAKGYMEKAMDMTENKYEKAFLKRELIKHLRTSNA
ncbi:MAG TPA: sigma factor, ECF subfamily protein [Cytophagales bacterium]|nr:sigma factor, ECF subfamily protein [Cytophagales bacterium]HAA22449.1 sigma factor, ECF subfamily protein [Cytophagales bacterium]HAP59750.1 sigma factor, ECF subfamily protein [Cytophagales bacterium]